MRTPRAPWLRRAALTAVIGCAALLSACGDDGGPGPTGEVAGAWSASDSTGTVFLVITADSVFEYDGDPLADCYEYVAYEIVEVDGRDFRLGTVADTFTVELYRDDEDLVVVAGSREVRYAGATVDPATLTPCPPPTVSATCSELQEIAIDSTRAGSITGSDDANADGTHYDLFRLDVVVADSLRVDMSASFDSYLNLFDAAGALLAANDDASTRTLDARLSRVFEPGCYIVMATTSFADAFGDFELSVTQE